MSEFGLDENKVLESLGVKTKKFKLATSRHDVNPLTDPMGLGPLFKRKIQERQQRIVERRIPQRQQRTRLPKRRYGFTFVKDDIEFPAVFATKNNAERARRRALGNPSLGQVTRVREAL